MYSKERRGINNKNFNINLSAVPRIDNPHLRNEANIMDLAGEKKLVSKLRMKALKEARDMPVSDDGTKASQTSEYVFSQPAIKNGSNWVQIGPTAIPYGQTFGGRRNVSVTGRITAIVLDPTDPDNIIYVGTAQGGVWKTKDGGRNWVAASDYAPSLSIGALVMDPKDCNVLYAGTGEGNIAIEHIGYTHPESYYGCGILKTMDGGQKWTLLGEKDTNPFIGASFFRLAINPKDSLNIFASTNKGLYRSTNGGQNWTLMNNGLPTSDIDNNSNIAATDVLIHPDNPNIVYVAFRRKDKQEQDQGIAGIYKTNEAKKDKPLWNKLSNINNFKPNECKRIALGISQSSPNILYALMANIKRIPRGYGTVIDKFYCTTDDGLSWKQIDLPGMTYDGFYPDSIGPQGDYNMNVAVDPTTADIVYLSGVSVWKAIRNSSIDRWEIRNIGQEIHADNHSFAINRNNPFTIYTGNDGGIFKSTDGGETWIDEINEGLCITTFEFMDQHPNSDAVVFGGTQDNGTLQFRNSPAFYYSAYGDGGFVSIDPKAPNIIISQYTNTALSRSEEGGKIDSWRSIEYGLKETDKNKPPTPSLFYAPLTLDQQDSRNIAFGADRIFLDMNQGLYGWRLDGSPVGLPCLLSQQEATALNRNQELISAINYVNSYPGLIYVATTYGKVFRVVKIDGRWNATLISGNSSLPERYIWDVATVPGNANAVIVVMAGYGSEEDSTSHIWSGSISENDGKAEWQDISRGKLPDTPINSIVIDPDPPHTIYVGTDIGVFRTNKNDDKTWIRFSEGLPNCAVYDMRLHTSTSRRLLRVATHGRGIWERDLDAKSMRDVQIFVRNNLMDTGRFTPVPEGITAAFEDPYQNEYQHLSIELGSKLSWDMCPDIKVDVPKGDPPTYQIDMEKVDYVKFESQLYHCNLREGRVSRVYVQTHNRGIEEANGEVKIKLLYANALMDNKGNIKYPDLPQDFWTAFPHDSLDISNWKPIGTYETLPKGIKTLTNTEPTVVLWHWNVPPYLINSASQYSIIGILVVIESLDDPIPQDNKIFYVDQLALKERHVGLRRVYVVKPE